MSNLSKRHKGFSLVELLIAIALSAIVAGVIIAIVATTTDSLAKSKSKIALQSEADVVENHLTTMLQEASDVTFDETKDILIVNNHYKTGTDKEKVVYWLKGNAIYYACPYVDPDSLTTAALPNYLLSKHVNDFLCETKTNAETGKTSCEITIQFANDKASFVSNTVVVPRNQ